MLPRFKGSYKEVEDPKEYAINYKGPEYYDLKSIPQIRGALVLCFKEYTLNHRGPNIMVFKEDTLNYRGLKIMI